jgi:dipeptidyl aminopeptidase/acylaminoacyl peptidase
MRRTLKTLLAGAAALGLTAAAPAPHFLTLDDILALRHVSEPQISPTGDTVLFQVESANFETDATDTHIWRANWDGTHARPLTTREKESETKPRWSPDGVFITFLSGRGSADGMAQLWRMSAVGGEAEQLTNLQGVIDDYAWAPDGKSLALIVRDAVAKDAPDAQPRPVVIDRFQFQQAGEGYLTTTRRHLYLFDIASRHATQLLRGQFDEALPAFARAGCRSVRCLAARRQRPVVSRPRNKGWAKTF